MVLGFSTKFPKGKGTLSNKSTFFIEKIWECILQKGIEINANDFIEYGRNFLPKNYMIGTHKPKLHTIRKDKNNRWKKGSEIHFSINIRTKEQQQFVPVIKVESVQKIEITEMIMTQTTYCYVTKNNKIYKVEVDGYSLTENQIKKLAINDGFNSADDFFEWFNGDFTGKIIHWTDLKY